MDPSMPWRLKRATMLEEVSQRVQVCQLARRLAVATPNAKAFLSVLPTAVAG